MIHNKRISHSDVSAQTVQHCQKKEDGLQLKAQPYYYETEQMRIL